MQLAPGVYTFPLDFDLDDRQLRVYPVGVETETGLILLDTGFPDAVDALTKAFRRDGLSLSSIETIILTHQDIDHTGAAHALRTRTKATVVAHRADAPYIEGEEDLLKLSPDAPFSYHLVTVDIKLHDKEVFRTAAGPLEAVATPGHTPGHMSYYLPDHRLLVSADALNNEDGLVGPREEVTPDMKTARNSVAKLAQLEIDRTLCYHGGPIKEGTDRIADLSR